MAIDTSKIEGYADMSAEDKVKALEAFEFEAPAPAEDGEKIKLKQQLSRANSEAAEFKRALREKQSEAERAEAERAEADKALREELAAYKAKERISGYNLHLVDTGYDAETAAEIAKELPDGIPDSFFAATKSFLAAQRKAAEGAKIADQMKLTQGKPLQGNDIQAAWLDAMRQAAGLK